MEAVSEPKTADELAETLKVSQAQLNAWLKELVKNGSLEKLSKRVRYQAAKGDDGLL